MLADVVGRVQGRVADDGFACGFVFQEFAHRHEGVGFESLIGRNAQPTVLLFQTCARTGDEEIILFLLNGQHIVFIFDSLTRFVADSVNNGWADVGVFFVFLRDGAHVVNR